MSAQARKIKLGPSFASPGPHVSLQNSKTYYPDGYFKRVGYQMSDAGSRVDALGQRVRDRFNEDLDIEAAKDPRGGLHSRTLKQLKQSNIRQGQASATGSRRSQADIWSANRQSLVKTSVKNKEDLRYATLDKDDLDQASIITKERLQKFNEDGAAAAAAAQDIEGAEGKADEAAIDDFERADEVGDLPEVIDAEEEKDDVRSLAAKSQASKASRKSNVTSKTYISKLELQLEQEKMARLRLEKEVEEMKKINAEISSKLGISTSSVATGAKEKTGDKRV